VRSTIARARLLPSMAPPARRAHTSRRGWPSSSARTPRNGEDAVALRRVALVRAGGARGLHRQSGRMGAQPSELPAPEPVPSAVARRTRAAATPVGPASRPGEGGKGPATPTRPGRAGRGVSVGFGGGRRDGRLSFDSLRPLHAFPAGTASLSQGSRQPGETDEAAAVPAQPVPAGAQKLEGRGPGSAPGSIDQGRLHLVVQSGWPKRPDRCPRPWVLSFAQPSPDQTGQGDWRARRKRPISRAVRRSRSPGFSDVVLIVSSGRDGIADRRAVGHGCQQRSCPLFSRSQAITVIDLYP
jgi:hypothetical protein